MVDIYEGRVHRADGVVEVGGYAYSSGGATDKANAWAKNLGYSGYSISTQKYSVTQSQADQLTKETAISTSYYFDVTSWDEKIKGTWGTGNTYSTEAEARKAMADTIRLQQLKAYYWRVTKWTTGEKAVTVIAEGKVLPDGWGTVPSPTIYYFRITGTGGVYLSENFNTESECRVTGILKASDRVAMASSDRGQLYIFSQKDTKETTLDIYFWGDWGQTDTSGWKPLSSAAADVGGDGMIMALVLGAVVLVIILIGAMAMRSKA